MRASLIVVVVVMGCRSHSDEAPAAKPHEAPAKVDPDGPCVTGTSGACKEHQPSFTAARRAATRVDLARGPADSGPLHAASRYAVAVSGAHPGKLCVHVEAASAGSHYMTRDWWASHDGWSESANGFAPAEPGASWDQQLDVPESAEHLVAIESEPASDFRVTIRRCP